MIEKEKTKRKKIVIGIFVLSALMMVFLFVWSAMSFSSEKTDSESAVHISGQYTGDNNEWQDFDSLRFKNNGYKEIKVQGKIINDISDKHYVILQLYDVWCVVKADDKIVCDNTKIKEEINTDTPGYSIKYIPVKDIDNRELEISLKYPYPDNFNVSVFSDVFSLAVAGDKDAVYGRFISNQLFNIILGIVILFFGIFGFGFSSTLFSKKGNNYFAFAFYAIASGLYIISSAIAPYLPLWVHNPFICMLSDEVWIYLVVIAVNYYLGTTLQKRITRLVMNFSLALSFAAFVVAFALQIIGVQDILMSEVFVYPAVLLGVIGGTVCLIYESFKCKNNTSGIVLVSMIPLILGALLELLNGVIKVVPVTTAVQFGMLLSIAIQFGLFALATKAHYKEMLEIEKMQSELLESRVSIMVSQIQPHFLYNSLTSIAMLCEKNPKSAKKATIEFADYLRGNMNSLKEKKPVPFSKELKHLETYLSLEKMRFGDDLNIEYNIETTDFSIPSLTVQPLVENAVKHGVGMKEDGGTVTIATREDENSYQIIVSDDGVGFDTTVKKNDGRQHVGMENCKSRLKTMCNGEVIITSKIGEGTVSKIIIPKEGI